jgi:hypothetical protein
MTELDEDEKALGERLAKGSGGKDGNKHSGKGKSSLSAPQVLFVLTLRLRIRESIKR